MTQITGTNREFLELLKGLEAIKAVQGKAFAILAARNIASLSEHLRPIDTVARPSVEFQKVSAKAHKMAEAEDAEAIEKLEEEHKELIEERKEQLNKVEEMLDTEAEVSVNLIREDLVPEDVTPEQILPLLKILKE